MPGAVGEKFFDPYETELDSFVKCLKNNVPFAISVEEARLAVYTVWQLYEHLAHSDL
jgi:hypothetical protein